MPSSPGAPSQAPAIPVRRELSSVLPICVTTLETHPIRWSPHLRIVGFSTGWTPIARLAFFRVRHGARAARIGHAFGGVLFAVRTFASRLAIVVHWLLLVDEWN